MTEYFFIASVSEDNADGKQKRYIEKECQVWENPNFVFNRVGEFRYTIKVNVLFLMSYIDIRNCIVWLSII